MLLVKLPVVERIHPQSDKFAMGVENKGTGNSKLNDSPGIRSTRIGPRVILPHDLREFST